MARVGEAGRGYEAGRMSEAGREGVSGAGARATVRHVPLAPQKGKSGRLFDGTFFF